MAIPSKYMILRTAERSQTDDPANRIVTDIALSKQEKLNKLKSLADSLTRQLKRSKITTYPTVVGINWAKLSRANMVSQLGQVTAAIQEMKDYKDDFSMTPVGNKSLLDPDRSGRIMTHSEKKAEKKQLQKSQQFFRRRKSERSKHYGPAGTAARRTLELAGMVLREPGLTISAPIAEHATNTSLIKLAGMFAKKRARVNSPLTRLHAKKRIKKRAMKQKQKQYAANLTPTGEILNIKKQLRVREKELLNELGQIRKTIGSNWRRRFGAAGKLGAVVGLAGTASQLLHAHEKVDKDRMKQNFSFDLLDGDSFTHSKRPRPTVKQALKREAIVGGKKFVRTAGRSAQLAGMGALLGLGSWATANILNQINKKAPASLQLPDIRSDVEFLGQYTLPTKALHYALSPEVQQQIRIHEKAIKKLKTVNMPVLKRYRDKMKTVLNGMRNNAAKGALAFLLGMIVAEIRTRSVSRSLKPQDYAHPLDPMTRRSKERWRKPIKSKFPRASRFFKGAGRIGGIVGRGASGLIGPLIGASIIADVVGSIKGNSQQEQQQQQQPIRPSVRPRLGTFRQQPANNEYYGIGKRLSKEEESNIRLGFHKVNPLLMDAETGRVKPKQKRKLTQQPRQKSSGKVVPLSMKVWLKSIGRLSPKAKVGLGAITLVPAVIGAGTYFGGKKRERERIKKLIG